MYNLNFPLILTLSRLILSPLLLPFLIATFLPYQNININMLLAFLFILLSITDFFDGYLARKNNQITLLGKLLDPLADKFLLFSTLISLCYIHKLYFYWAIIFIAREFFIMGLRELALSNGFIIAVSQTAKWKTVTQLLYLCFVIINPKISIEWDIFESLLLIIALCFSLYSAYEYCLLFLKNQQGQAL